MRTSLHRLCCSLVAFGLLKGAQADNYQISYVIEPFDHINDVVFNHTNLESTLTAKSSDWVFGRGAAKLTIAPNSTGKIEQVAAWDEQRHNCVGATHFSLWYKTNTTNCRVSLSFLIPEVPCNDPDCAKDIVPLEIANASSVMVADEEWHELVWMLDQDNAHRTLTDNLDQLLGWFITFHREAESRPNMTSSVVLDHFACFGGGDLFGAAFKTRSTIEVPIFQGIWQSKNAWQAYSAQTNALQSSKAELKGQRMVLDPYVIEHSEPSWGGNLGFGHLGPFSSYYNLSGSRSLALDYDVLEPADPRRVHFRIILYDIEGCENSCGNINFQEHFYSFHSILDTKGPGVITVGLQGSASDQSTFEFTGWGGANDNQVLDLDHVKGVAFELSIDNLGEVGSTASGSLSFGPSSVSNGELQMIVPGECQEGEIIAVNHIPDYFQAIQHEQNCCERCLSDSKCFFAFSKGVLCYLAPYVGPGVLGVKRDILADYEIFAVDSGLEFCEVCNCDKEIGLIDCSGRDLEALPSTLLSDGGWVPRVLDLQNNPKLSFIGRHMLLPLGEHIETIILPQSIDYLSGDAVESLPNLSILRSDNGLQDMSANTPHHGLALQNAIVGGNGLFGNVCCGKGASVVLDPPIHNLTFCNITRNTGADAEFLPFVSFRNADEITFQRLGSSPVGDASKSPESCAEYCSETPGCRYFTLDRRISETEHTCRLFLSSGTHTDTSCCKREHYADSEQTIPGYVSGLPALTRHENGASVVISKTKLLANAKNDYTAQYELSLGAMPLRGAVWVTPTVSSATLSAVSVSPKKIALYDNTTIIAVTVSVQNANKRNETIVLMNNVESCDTAFLPLQDDISNMTTFFIIEVQPTVQLFKILFPSLLGGVAVIVALVLAIALRRRRVLRRKSEVNPNLSPVSAVLVVDGHDLSRTDIDSATVFLPVEVLPFSSLGEDTLNNGGRGQDFKTKAVSCKVGLSDSHIEHQGIPYGVDEHDRELKSCETEPNGSTEEAEDDASEPEPIETEMAGDQEVAHHFADDPEFEL